MIEAIISTPSITVVLLALTLFLAGSDSGM